MAVSKVQNMISITSNLRKQPSFTVMPKALAPNTMPAPSKTFLENHDQTILHETVSQEVSNAFAFYLCLTLLILNTEVLYAVAETKAYLNRFYTS